MDSFILYTNYSKHLKLLTHEQKGKLLDALFSFAECGGGSKLDQVTDMAFSFIKEDIELNNAKWLQTKENRKVSGKKGGLAKASKTKQTLTNVAVNVNGNVNVNDNENNEEPRKARRIIFETTSKPYQCAKYLANQLLERLDTKTPEAILQNWSDAFDKLNRIDKRDWNTIGRVLEFSQEDEFWQKNILSGDKFRKQFVKLYAQTGGSK